MTTGGPQETPDAEKTTGFWTFTPELAKTTQRDHPAMSRLGPPFVSVWPSHTQRHSRTQISVVPSENSHPFECGQVWSKNSGMWHFGSDAVLIEASLCLWSVPVYPASARGLERPALPSMLLTIKKSIM